MLKDFLKSGLWFVSRDMSLAVWDEYIPCDSWSGHRKLNEVLTYYINIYGVYKPNSYGLKPKGWSAYLRYNGYSYRVQKSHPSCKSIKDALCQADKSLTETIFIDACKWFMSRQIATCIVKEDLTPFCTSFGNPQWQKSYLSYSKSLYPYGQYYYAYRYDKDVKFASVTVFPYGYSSSGSKREKLFEHWL